MRKIPLYFLVISLLSNCASIEKQNKLLETNLTVNEQLEDINFLEKKIKKIQPSLYNFITEDQFNYKFDSLRNTIETPLKPREFYYKVSPLLASIKQGHSSISQTYTTPIPTKKETKKLKEKGLGPMSQFEFKWKSDKVYIIANKSKDSSIKLGTEVVSINEITPKQIYSKYRKSITSDGENTTWIPHLLTKRFSTFMYYEVGMQDSLMYQFKYNDSIFFKTIKRLPKEKKETVKTKDVVKNDTLDKKPIVVSKEAKKAKAKEEKAKKRAERDKKFLYGYDITKKEFIKTLKFTDTDSLTAILKIKNFSQGDYKSAYKEFFSLLRKKETQNLVLDLRGNPGGRLNDIQDLYSYLTVDSTFQLLEKTKVTRKSSVLMADYLKSVPKLAHLVVIPTYPIYASIMLLKTKKADDGNYYFALASSKVKPHKANYFKGNIYVLIDGGSFSASCIISSKLKENKDIIFVGEETGGTFNGTVAGRRSTYSLPNSKLKTNLWIMDLVPTYKSNQEGRGIFPDVEIIPTIEDIITNKDPELDWIKEDIKKKSSQ
jgi:C-terminal processing protease CtpA/Prc